MTTARRAALIAGLFSVGLLTSAPAAAGPAALVLQVSDATVAEGNSGQTLMTFEVRRIGQHTGQSQTVSYSTADGDATAGSDYIAAAGTLVFDKKTDARFVTVAVSGDTDQEPDEYFLLVVTPAGGGDGEGRGRIRNDDGWPPS